MKNYIIGAGLSGLICNYYNKDYTIISPDVGGQLKDSKNVMITFYLHNTPEICELLKELNIAFTVRRIRILYYYNKKIFEKPDNFLRHRFVINKMCEFDNDSNDYLVQDTTLSTDNNYLEVLDCDIDLLMEKLKPKTIINGKLKIVNSSKKLLYVFTDKLEVLEYDRIISTVPATEFFRMLYNYYNHYKFKYLPTTYVLSSEKPKFVVDDNIYYVCDSDLIYNRVQKYNGNFIYEITGVPVDYDLNKSFKNIIAVERRYVGLIKSEDVVDLKNIKFVGRMAQWSHSIKTQDCIAKAKLIAGVNDG